MTQEIAFGLKDSEAASVAAKRLDCFPQLDSPVGDPVVLELRDDAGWCWLRGPVDEHEVEESGHRLDGPTTRKIAEHDCLHELIDRDQRRGDAEPGRAPNGKRVTHTSSSPQGL